MSIWTDEHVATAIKLFEAGLSGEAIAAKLGSEFTRSMVVGKLRRLGRINTRAQAHAKMRAGTRATALTMALRGRGGHWNQEKDDFLRANARTMTAAAIGRRLNKSEKAVVRRASRLKVSLAKDGIAPGPDTSWVPAIMRLQAGNDDHALVERFLVERPVTVCPSMPAQGAVYPAYIGKARGVG